MAKMDDEPRASVEIGCEKILGCGVGDGDGGEESRRAEITGNGIVKAVMAGSIVARGGTSVEKSIGEARLTENLPCKPDASAVLPTQLTIFFGGKVSVFDGIAAERVHEILRIAAKARDETKNPASPVPSPALNRAPSFSSTSTAASPAAPSFPIQPISFCRSAADLPIARRHSLQRFLEKRRNRLVSKSPYPTADIKKEAVVPTCNTSIKEEYPTA